MQFVTEAGFPSRYRRGKKSCGSAYIEYVDGAIAIVGGRGGGGEQYQEAGCRAHQQDSMATATIKATAMATGNGLEGRGKGP